MANIDDNDTLYNLEDPLGHGPNTRRHARRNRIIVKWLWISFLSVGFLIVFLMLLIYNGVIGYMPPIEELEDPHDKLASLVYASDGSELGRYYYGAGNRVYTDYNGISPHVINALVATEDVRFREHSGIDFKALGRTAFKTLLMGDKSAGGASTITQQLVKNVHRRQRGDGKAEDHGDLPGAGAGKALRKGRDTGGVSERGVLRARVARAWGRPPACISIRMCPT